MTEVKNPSPENHPENGPDPGSCCGTAAAVFRHLNCHGDGVSLGNLSYRIHKRDMSTCTYCLLYESRYQ